MGKSHRIAAALLVFLALLLQASVLQAAISPAPPLRRSLVITNRGPAAVRPAPRTAPKPNLPHPSPVPPRSSLSAAAAQAHAKGQANTHTNAPSAQAKAAPSLAERLGSLQPGRTLEMALGIALLVLATLFIFLAKTSSGPLPVWLKWGCRLLGVLIILAVLLPLAASALALSGFFQTYGGSIASQEQLLASLLGQLTGQLILLSLGIWLLRCSVKPAPAAAQASALPAPMPSRAAVKLPKSASRHVQVCNVLQHEPAERKLWHFETRSGGFVLNRQQTSLAEEPLPSGLIRKSWATLFQRKLNVAWLPPEHVFLRVAQFPASDFTETLSMVELQLEKLSPMPVTQIVWTIELMPHSKGNLQTVVVIIAARNAVEEFLGQLEGQGYLADRLELPVLDELQATPINEDGAWIYPAAGGAKNSALAAWWYGGVLHNLDFLSLPPANNPGLLKEQLLQMAWAGELEGWLTSPPRWHVVAEPAVAAPWEAALRAGLDQPVEVTAPLPAAELAGRTARRAATADPRANLLPLEFSTRYQQQFVDRLWMRGLLAIGAVYLVGVAIYGIALGVLSYSTGTVEDRVWEYSQSYSNAVQLTARYQVLKDRQDLKFAALECWNYVAKLMPAEMTLDTLNFADGKKLTLVGTVPGDQTTLVNDFETAMRKAKDAKGQDFFDPLAGEHFTMHQIPGGGATWTFSLELKHSESLK